MEFTYLDVRKLKTLWSTKKVRVTEFWEAEGFVCTEFIPKGTTIDSENYRNTFQKLKTLISCIKLTRTPFFISW